ncbi:MAG: GNAT family N-acetyltransferase [Bacteroidales bacterium]|nr:GNAT family N-acetyltransferase [Bacteroidales bacterium]
MTNKISEIRDSKTEIKILSASEVRPDLLSSFYSSAYPVRAAFMESNWSWINRAYYHGNRIPLVLISDEKVIAHAGLIPVTMQIGGKDHSAGWFIDLAVLPEYQRSGYGSILVRKRMELSEIQMTFPNKRSRGIFKKLGWHFYSDSNMHYIFLRPFNYPALKKWLPSKLRFILNQIYFSLMRSFYLRNSLAEEDINLDLISPISLKEFLSAYNNEPKASNEEVVIVRDEDYMQWRVLNSPNRSQYYIYSNGDFHALVYFNNRIGDSIDVLLMSDDSNNEQIKTMLCSLAIKGESEGYAFIRLLTTHESLTTYVRRNARSFVRQRDFVFNSKNQSLLNIMKNLSWRLALIDSDFEFTN